MDAGNGAIARIVQSPGDYRSIKRLVVRRIILRREGLPSLARAPSPVRTTVRVLASGGLLICLAILLRVVPPVLDALRSPDPWTSEGFFVLIIVVWLGCDTLRYGRLAIRP